jgi:hypothetical protein
MNIVSIGDIYAVHTGAFAGEMIICVGVEGKDYCFLATPTMLNRKIPRAILEHGRNHGIIKFVEQSPDYVLEVSKAQYKLNEDSNNRRE